MINRAVVFLIFILIVIGCGHSKSNKPNILLIVSDDQGYHDVSYYGTKDIRTPIYWFNLWIKDSMSRIGINDIFHSG